MRNIYSDPTGNTAIANIMRQQLREERRRKAREAAKARAAALGTPTHSEADAPEARVRPVSDWRSAS